MTTPKTWLLAGASLALCAGAAMAMAADPVDVTATVDQARADSQAAEADAWAAQQDVRSAQAEARARQADARRAREEAREQVRAARDQIRVYRSGDDGDRDITIISGGDRAEQLSAILQLRADQQAALRTFIDATRNDHDRPADHMVRFDRDGGEGRTTLQRLEEMQARAAQQRADMDRKVAAIKAFYAQLDAPQKKAFDSMPMLMMVGPNIGPMMLPRPIPIVHRIPPVPPVPPIPPVPPRS